MVRQADSNHQDAGAPVTLERIYPDAIPVDALAQKLSLELPLQRYRFASQPGAGQRPAGQGAGRDVGQHVGAQ